MTWFCLHPDCDDSGPDDKGAEAHGRTTGHGTTTTTLAAFNSANERARRAAYEPDRPVNPNLCADCQKAPRYRAQLRCNPCRRKAER